MGRRARKAPSDWVASLLSAREACTRSRSGSPGNEARGREFEEILSFFRAAGGNRHCGAPIIMRVVPVPFLGSRKGRGSRTCLFLSRGAERKGVRQGICRVGRRAGPAFFFWGGRPARGRRGSTPVSVDASRTGLPHRVRETRRIDRREMVTSTVSSTCRSRASKSLRATPGSARMLGLSALATLGRRASCGRG